MPVSCTEGLTFEHLISQKWSTQLLLDRCSGTNLIRPEARLFFPSLEWGWRPRYAWRLPYLDWF